jgi:hypothetical protein
LLITHLQKITAGLVFLFFYQFNFFIGPDPTHGFVEFLDEEFANAVALTGFVNRGAANATYMGVDSQNITPEAVLPFESRPMTLTTTLFSSLTLHTCRQDVVHGRVSVVLLVSTVSGFSVLAVPSLTPERSTWLSR